MMKVQNGRPVYTLTFDDADLLELHNALLERPFKVAAPLINRINSQLAAQREPGAVPPDGGKDLPELPEGADYIRHQNGMPRPS
jgi:hypothetical protein